jgi:hypothetical protein
MGNGSIAYDELQRQKRIFSYDWNDYSADKAVYYPKNMTPEKLTELLDYAWKTFYSEESQAIKMFRLYRQVIRKEQADGTFRPKERNLTHQVLGEISDNSDLVRLNNFNDVVKKIKR